MSWKTVRLELARSRGFPAGSVSRGYVIRLPLDASGELERTLLVQHPGTAVARRFWSTDPDETGRVVCSCGGLAVRCSGRADRLIETFHFEPGGKVTLVDEYGARLLFTVASIGNPC